MTTPQGPPDSPPFTFEIADDFTKGLEQLQPAHLNDVMAFLRDHAAHTPTTLIPGQLKALRGTWLGVYEYHISRSLRMRYEVDETARIVRLRWLGQHRGNEYSRDRQGR